MTRFGLSGKTTPEDKLDGRENPRMPRFKPYSVPGVRVTLFTECHPKVKMKGDEDMVKVREAVTRAIDNLLEEAATNSRSKDSLISTGAVVVVCEDEATLNCLLEVAPSFDMTGGLKLHR